MLGSDLARVAKEFVYERAKPFSRNSLAHFIRHDLADSAKRTVMYRPDEYKIKGSAGAGNWAAVPWLGFFDPIITESAQSGFYVVFLINPQTLEIFLSLNQGTTEVYREYGQANGLIVLRRRAQDIRQRINDHVTRFDTLEISLGSRESLPAGYEAGHALGFKFDAENFQNEDIATKLHTMLDVYQVLISRGGLIPSDIMFEDTGSKDIEECRRYVLSKRIERSAKVRREVLSNRPLICDACGLDPVADYGYSGPPINTPLDVHHQAPLKGLAEGEKKRYRVPEDFTVLCPTCHRLIHKQADPSDVEELKQSIRFRHMREIF